MTDNLEVMLHPIDAHSLRLPRDRVIETAWRWFLSVLIFAGASVAVMLAYFAFFALLSRNWSDGSACVIAAIALGAGVTWLCYHRDDLVGALD